MDKKITSSEHSPRAFSLDLNLPLEQSAEQDKNSCTSLDPNLPLEQSAEHDNNSCDFVNLVSQGRTHHGLRDGDLPRRSSITGHSSHSHFTGNSTSEAEPNLFQQSVPNTCLSFHPYKRRVSHADDGTVGSGFPFDIMLPPTIGDVTDLVDIDFNQGEPVIFNMSPNAFHPSSLPSHPQIPDIDDGIMGGNCQIDKSLNQSINHQTDPGYSGPFSFGHKEDSTFMIQPGDQVGQAFNFGQNQHLVIPWSNSEPHTGLVSDMDQLSRVYCTGGAGYYNQLGMQTGVSTDVHNPGENKNNGDPYTGPGPSMHASDFNPTTSSKYVMQHLSISDQIYLEMMQNGSLDDHSAPTRTPDKGDNVSHMTPRGLDKHCGLSRASISAAGVSDQLYPPPAQHSLSNQNMRNPGGNNSANANYDYVSGQHAENCYQDLATQQSTVQDPELLNAKRASWSQQLYPDGVPRDPAPGLLDGLLTVDGGRMDLNAGETQTKVVSLTRPSSEGLSPVTTQGLGGSVEALQNARRTPVRARSTVAVHPYVQASGNKSVMSQTHIKASQAPSSMDVFIPAPQGEVAPGPMRGRAPAETLLRSGKARLPVAPRSSRQRRAAAPGLEKMKPPATIQMRPDVIRRRNGEASGRGMPAPLGARCDLCSIDLAFTPSGAASGTFGDPPASAVHPCGHRFHDVCLREIGVATDCKDPPCIACGFIHPKDPDRR